MLSRKGRILAEHCAAVGRDATQITRSANMPMLITENAAAKERVVRGLMQRFGRTEQDARDTVLVGSVAEIQDTIGRMQEAGVDQVFIPTFLPPYDIEQLDRFIGEVAPAFR